MSVHYKFKSSLEYDTVTFDGLHISVGDLKKAIVHQKRIGKNTDFDLQVTNAQTKEVYSDENVLIPKNTSLIIARVPQTSQPNKRSQFTDTVSGGFGGGSPSLRTADDGATGAPLSKAVDLSRLDASEEDKIRAMMTQSTQDYDPSNYMKIRGANQMGEVPANYRCFKCHQPGHWIKNCPLGLNQEPIEIKKSTGIPRSFMVPVEGPMVPGAMMTPTGQYAVPALDHQAYNSGGGGRGDPEIEERPDIPEDLVCSICKDLLTDAVMIPCCGNSFCDECIRTILLESEDHECPDCHEKDISPGTLIPNRYLRNSVASFKSETGYRKRQQYRHVIEKQAAVESTTAEIVPPPEKPPKIELPDFIPPPNNDPSNVKPPEPISHPDQKPVISEADSTDQTKQPVSLQVVSNVEGFIKTENDDSKIENISDDSIKPIESNIKLEQSSSKSDHLSIQSKNAAPNSRELKPLQDPLNMPLSSTHIKSETMLSTYPQAPGSSQTMINNVVNPSVTHVRRPGTSTQQPHILTQLPQTITQMPVGEERPGTPTVDEPGVGITAVGVSYPPGETPPFVSPSQHSGLPSTSQNMMPSINPIVMRPTLSASAAYPHDQTAPYISSVNAPPTHYHNPPYGLPPSVRGPASANTDFNSLVRPYAPRSHYDQLPPSIRGYDPARPPPPFQGYPPRGPMSGPRAYAPRHHLSSGMRPPHNGMNQHGVIDDPLAAFERMLREKDERDRRAREASRRSRSRSYSPRGRRSLSSSRSRSYSPGTRSPRSRSPPPARKRTRSPRSRSPRSHSRGSVRRRSRTRSRDRSFSISRSRSFSRSPSPRISPREYSPRRRPMSRNRYRSPLQSRHSPQRYRYQERRPPPMERERERGGYIPPVVREREYGSYYDAPPPNVDYPPYERGPIEHRDYRQRDRDRERMPDRISERERDVDRDRDHERDRERDRRGMPMQQNQRLGRGAHPPQRYLPSPPPTMRKDYPQIGIIPPVPPGTPYYSIQEHGMYHHHHHHHHPEVPPIVAGPGPNRYQSRGPANDYPSTVPSEKAALSSGLIRDSSPAIRYDPRAPTPPGTEQPTVPGFESPRLDKALPISDAPPGVDPSAGDTVITGPLVHEKTRPETKDHGAPKERSDRNDRDRGRDNRDRGDQNRGRDYDGDRNRYDKKTLTPDRKHRSGSSPRRGTSSRDRHASADKHRKHRYDSPDDRDKNRERRASESDKEHSRHTSDRRGKDSYDDDKSKKNKDKKKRRKEKEAEKTKKKEEKKKRKEQEKLKKAEEKKTKGDDDDKEVKQEEESKPTESKSDENNETKVVPVKEPVAVDLYDETLKDGVDTKVIETYTKVNKDIPIKLDKISDKKEVDTPVEENDDKDVSFDGLDLHANEYDLLKPEINEVKKSKTSSSEVLATLPVLSKWEMEEDADKKEHAESKADIKSFFEKPPSKIVTSEVLKHAENAIFKKAINAIRPIEIKKISVDRAKLYSGEKNETSPLCSPQRVEKEKEPITISNIQVTIPTNDWEMRLVDINPPAPDIQRIDRERTTKRKTPPVRLSVRERLGSKVEELDKITKEEKVYDRNRSRTLSPLSRRERDGSGRNITVTDSKRTNESDRRKKAPEPSERVAQRRDYGRSRNTESRSDHDRRTHSRVDRSRSRDRSHRDRDSRRSDKRPSYRRDDYGDDFSRRDVVRRSEIRKPERKDDRRESGHGDKQDDRQKDYRDRDDKHNKDKKKERRSRSRSESSDKKSVDRDKRRKKDKKHKRDKEKEKLKKNKKDDVDTVKKVDKNEEEGKGHEDQPSENMTAAVKKIPERRKPTLDESNFEPDYDALETESEGDDKEKEKSKTDSAKKRERSKSSEKPSEVDLIKKRKLDESVETDKKSKSKEPDTSSSDSSSDSSSSSEEKQKRKHRKHKNKKKSKKVSSSSSSDSDSDSSSDDDSKKKKSKSRKHKSSKKAIKKKKKSKHR